MHLTSFDANDLVDFGVYIANGNANIENTPSKFGVLIVFGKSTSLYTAQVFIEVKSSAGGYTSILSHRLRYSGGWTSWKTVTNE